MELDRQSDLISLELDTGDGATSPILYYHKGYLSEEGGKGRWFAAQVTEDNRIKIYRKTDFKAESISLSTKSLQFEVATEIVKTGTMNYVNRMSTNINTQIMQQTSPTRQWVFYQHDWTGNTFTKNLILDIQPDSNSTIDYLTRYKQHLYFRVIDNSTNWWIYYLDLSTYSSFGTVLNVTDTLSITKDKTDFCAGENYFYVIEDGNLKIYDHGNLTSPSFTESSIITDTEVEIREIDDWDLFVRASGTVLYRVEFDGSTTEVTILSSALETDTENYRILTRGEIYVEAVEISRTPNAADEHKDNWYIIGENAEINALLSGIVGDICQDVGISDINVTSLNGIIVQGFLINNYSISDSFMKQLMMSYQFDMPESGGELKFLKRGTAVTQTIADDRLGAIVSNISVGNTFPEKIAQTFETSRLIPREFKVIYLEQLKDYDQTEQSIIRQDAKNRDQQILDMSAFAWSDSIARQIADKSIALFFSERSQYIIFVSAYYYNVEPGDIINIEIDEEDINIRVTETLYTYPGIIQIQGVFDNANDYESDIEGISGDEPAQDFSDFNEYEIIVLDTNTLFDSNASNTITGVYAIARSLGISFDNPLLLRTLQAADNWIIQSSIAGETIIGTCITKLESGTVDIIDLKNSVQIQISTSESLFSISESDLLDESNMCAITSGTDGQYEILYFQNAVEIGSGDGIWEISNFIRGGKGTEHLISDHVVGDLFTLIENNNIANSNNLKEDIGKTYDYTSIEQGDDIPENDEDVEAYRNTLVARRSLPFSVSHEDAIKNSGTNNITISWIRRSRYGGQWQDTVDVIESEPTEEYEVDILDGSTIVRTLVSSTNSVIYNSTQQTADFGSSISNLNCKIYKIHNIFGRGYEKELNKTF